MNFRLKKKYFLTVLLLIIILYLFWGPLFPWSPVKPGFSIIEKKWATVYFQEFEDDIAVNNLDDIINELENFHNLKFNEDFKIIILGKHSNMKRYLPWMSGSGYSVKLGFANVIYIGANARYSRYGIGVFLKHELSHLLIHQNVPSAKYNFEIQKQGWLAEGIAAYIGGPNYYKKNEFVPLWKNNGMSFNSLYEADVIQVDKDIVRLYYTYYRFFY